MVLGDAMKLAGRILELRNAAVPAAVEATELIADGLEKGLVYKEPGDLLSTAGRDWDYRGSDELLQQLQAPLGKLRDNKGKGTDKQEHPLLLVFAGPGQGKSRLLQELPRLVCDAGKLAGDIYSFLLTLENGTWYRDEDGTPARMVALRMLWQLVRHHSPAGWAGLRPGFGFADLRRCAPKDLDPEMVLGSLARGMHLESKPWNAILVVDGMQQLPGFGTRDEAAGNGTYFYRTMRIICELVNRNEQPLVVGCVAATESLPLAKGLADSPQDRVFLQVPPVDRVLRRGQEVLPMDDPIIRLLAEDMGGHGRALEALEVACAGRATLNATTLLQAVIAELGRKYPDARNDFSDQILKCALAGQWLQAGSLVGGKDPAKVPMVRLEYADADPGRFRLRVPYIWIHLGATAKGASRDLARWRMDTYEEMESPPDAYGDAWEAFNTRFRALRSCLYADGGDVLWSELHYGAILNPPGLDDVMVVNRHLIPVQATSWCCTNHSNLWKKKGQGRVVLRGNVQTNPEKNVTELRSGKYLVRNAARAPAADSVILLQLSRSQGERAEASQAKQGGDPLKDTEIANEVAKAKETDAEDLLLFFCTAPQSFTLPKWTGLVGPAQFDAYYGPYVGRCHSAAQRERLQP